MTRLLAGRYAAEAIDWERLVVVVGLNDSADVPQRLLVLVWLIVAAVVERVGCTWIAVAASVVDGSDEADLPACAQVVDKSGWNEDVELSEG